MSSSKKKAMQAIRELAEAKKGGVKRSSQLKFDEEELFDYVDEEEYQQKVQDRRAMQDFVVDDNGLGYVDDGEEYDADSYDEDEAEGAEEAEEDGPLGGQKRRRQLASLAGKKGVLSSMFKKSGSSSLDAVKKARATSAMQALTADADIDDLLTGGGADDALGLDGTITAAFKRARRTSRPASRKHAETSGAASRGVHFASPATEGATSSTAGADAGGSGPGTATQGSQAAPSSRDRLSAALAAQAQSKEAPSKARARRKAEALQAAAAAARGAAAEGVDMSRSEEGEWFAMQASSAAAGAAGPVAPETDSDLPLYHVPGKEASQKVACLRVFWLDAYENSRRDPGVLYLFGKVLMEAGRPERSAAYASICVKVTGLERCMFVLPRTNARDDGGPVSFTEVYGEVKQHVQRLLPPGDAGMFRVKKVSRNYAFELPDVPRDVQEYMKIKYPAQYPALPSDLSGNTFSRVFGTNTSSLENFLLKRDLMGPCWLELRNVTIRSSSVSWCKFEVEVGNPKDIVRLDKALTAAASVEGLPAAATAPEPPSPPLTVASLSLKTVVSPTSHMHEVVMASVVLHQDVSIDGATDSQPTSVAHFTVLRAPSAKQALPLGFKDALAAEPQHVKDSLRVVPNERALLSFLMARIAKLDPDALVGHNINGFDLDVLLHRMGANKVPNWSMLGRLRLGIMPKPSTGSGGKEKFVGNLTAGRLLVDTYLTARELVRETTYALTALAKTRLGQQRVDVDPLDVPKYFAAESKDVIWLARHTQNDAWLALQLMFKLQILPLTKQLTNLSGNLWSRSLKGARAERIEYLLLHEFHRLKFIKPDKENPWAKGSAGETGGATGVAARNAKKRGKPKYSGGLVLEPKKGLYDKFVLMLDFNSLYPSIIQEYNICFTTVDRRLGDADVEDGDEEEGGGAALAPLPEPTAPDGILPRVIRTLVQRRRAVKNQMKSERNAGIKAQLDIRQLALKILANSMYGCLGFKHSRFYAQPLAALITHQGREILQNTVDLAERELGLDVIYGDTDSIMIYTNSTDLAEVRAMGGRVKREVNKLYKKLEIEIDGVYAMMLLLKKKKYAALTVEEGPDGTLKYDKEMKGLDLVRRDWCVLSKEVGKQVLDKILDRAADKEKVADDILELLGDLATRARGGEIATGRWVITKGLNKSPHDYPDAKSQPHLQVALRMMAAGKTVNVGDHVPYVITKPTAAGATAEGEAAPATASRSSKQSVSDRARHPTEVARSAGALTVDVEWYLANQILPPIARLCDPIDGLAAARLAEAMGIDASRFASSVRYGSSRDDEGFTPKYVMDDAERFKDAQPLLAMCTRCGVLGPFAGVVHPASISQAGTGLEGVAGVHCVEAACGGVMTAAPEQAVAVWTARAAEVKRVGGTAEDVAALRLYVHVPSLLPSLRAVAAAPPGTPPTVVEKDLMRAGLTNAAVLAARRAIMAEGKHWLQCDDSMCGLRTRAVGAGRSGAACPRARCKGQLHFEYPAATLHTQLEYLLSLFDVRRAMTKNAAAVEEGDAAALDTHPRPQLDPETQAVYDSIARELRQCLAANAFHFVRPKPVFGYMHKVNKARRAASKLHAAAASTGGMVQLALLAAGGALSGKQSTRPLLAMTDV